MEELTLSGLLDIFKKCLIYIIIAVIVCAAGAFCYCEFIATPTYVAKVSFMGANSSGFGAQTSEGDTDIKSTDIAASRAIILTYIELFKTTDFFEMVVERSGLEYSANQIKSMVSFSQRTENSLFIDVQATSANPKEAIKIAETIYSCGGEYLSTLLPNAYIKAIEGTNSIARQNYPVTSSAMAISALVGAAFVFALSFIITIIDKAIKGEKDFEAKYDIPVLGYVPNFQSAAREENK